MENLEKQSVDIQKSTGFRLLAVCLCAALCCSAPFFLSAQNTPGEKIRFELWALVDEEPSVPRSGETGGQFAVPVGKLKELAPFVLEGMIYGWNFSYTPSDVRRAVPEYFEMEPAGIIAPDDRNLSFREAAVGNNRLYCYVEYLLSGDLSARRRQWSSVVYPKIQGTGRGKLSDGIAGQKAAYADAVKLAVRSYAQNKVKNKPKEITGTVVLRSAPRMYIADGFYTADLDFFLYVGKMIPYLNY